MIPTHCFFAEGFGDFVFLLIFLGIIVVKFASKALQASKQEGSGARDSSRPSRREPTSAEKVQAFLDQIAHQASGERPAAKRPTVVPPRPQPAPQARPVRKAQPSVTEQRVSEQIRREEESKGRELSRLEKRRIQSALEKRHVKARVEKRTYRKVAPAPVKPARVKAGAKGAAQRLDALLPSDPFKRAILLRDILGPCRASEPIESDRW